MAIGRLQIWVLIAVLGLSTSLLWGQAEVVREVELQWDAHGAKVDIDLIRQGCPRPDCIPAINSPNFDTVAASTWLRDDSTVFLFTYKNDTRLYPQGILNWHEIVNDWIGGEAIAITYCPLCGSATAFSRTVNGTITEFGVSGMLFDSDLVMYDRFEGNLWQQITGEAIVGPAARRDESLKLLPIYTLSWKEAKRRFPNAKVLSRRTGHFRDYNYFPYGKYEHNDAIFFPVRHKNDSLHPKTMIYGLTIGEKAKAYPLHLLKPNETFVDKVGQTRLRITLDADRLMTVVDDKTGALLTPHRMFWFAWVSFNPKTLIYRP